MIAIVGIAAGIFAAIGTRTADDLADGQTQQDVLDFIQRERNAHVNRGMEGEALVFCPSVAGVCNLAGADELTAHRVAFPTGGVPAPASRIASARFAGNAFDFAGGVLVVDAFARSVNDVGVPTPRVLRLVLKGGVEDILFRADGAVVPSFDAPAALVVTPHITDVSARTTPNPTPQAAPTSSFRARRVAME